MIRTKYISMFTLKNLAELVDKEHGHIIFIRESSNQNGTYFECIYDVEIL